MSLKTLVKLLEDTKFDVHYGEAPDGTKCPYVVLTDHEQPNFAADNKTYTETTSLRIRLVESGVHNWTLIGTLKSVLDGASLPYGITYVEETSEKVCETYFDIRFLGGIDNA